LTASIWYIVANIGTLLEIISFVKPIIVSILQAETQYPITSKEEKSEQNRKKRVFVGNTIKNSVTKRLVENGMKEQDVSILLQAFVIIVKQWDKVILPAIKGKR